MASGRIAQIIGAVIDVEFPAGEMPALYNALEVEAPTATTGWCSRSNSMSATAGCGAYPCARPRA